jgi:RNA exonuclease 4
MHFIFALPLSLAHFSTAFLCFEQSLMKSPGRKCHIPEALLENLENMTDVLSKSLPRTPSAKSTSSFCPQALVSPEISSDGFLPFVTRRFVGLDCEMVGVGPGGARSVLARVSLVGFNGHCLFDTFVRVEEHVTDYRTHISGVYQDDLKSPRAISYGKCRNQVKALITGKILVGHGLKNDLIVLSIQHPWYNIRDTSMYQPYMKVDNFGRLRPRRLKELASAHLGILIQQHGVPHDSVDDAAAAMALYQKAQAEWDFAMDCKRRTLLMQSPPRALLMF